MGDFESLKVTIGLKDEPHGEETHAEAFERIKAFVERRLWSELEAIETTIKGG